MNKLSKKEFKNMLYEWKILLEQRKEELTLSDIAKLHTEGKTLYHITHYPPEKFNSGLKLDNATSLSTKQASSGQGSGIYFFCKPKILEKAFSNNNADYLLIVEKDYKNNLDFLPDLEICAGFFVDWYVNNIDRLTSNGFTSSVIRKHFVKGGPHPILSSGSPHTALVPQGGKMHVLSRYKSYESFASESGEIVYQALEELKSFSMQEYTTAIDYIMSNDIDAVKYVSSSILDIKNIYKLDKSKNTFKEHT